MRTAYAWKGLEPHSTLYAFSPQHTPTLHIDTLLASNVIAWWGTRTGFALSHTIRYHKMRYSDNLP